MDALNSYYLIPKSARSNNYEEIVRVLDDGTAIRLSDALFVTCVYETSKRKALTFLPSNLSVETYDNWLDTVCTKYKITNSNGEEIRINSHQFRHFLTTMYTKGGLTDEEIARIFGRKDIRQNKDYTHISSRERKSLLYMDIRENRSIGVISDTYKQIKLISYEQAEEFLVSVIEATHLTEYGACVLDWSRQPCPHHMSCLTGRDGIACRNLVIVKGNPQSLVQIEREYKVQKLTLEKAVASESPFSQDWIKTITAKINNMKTIIEIHKDSLANNEVGIPTFPFPDGSTPESITFGKDAAEMRRMENR